jgi:signal transduction histidine kinase
MTGWLRVLLAGTLLVALAVLGTLQYRWIGDLSAAEEQRLRGALDSGARHVAEDVDREIGRLGGTFRDASTSADDIARSLRQWTASARGEQLLEGVYVTRGRGTEMPPLQVLKTAPNKAWLVDVGWPADMMPIAQALIHKREGERKRVPQFFQSIPALCIPARNEEPPPPRERRGPPPPPREGEFGMPPQPPPEGEPLRPRNGPPPLLVLKINRDYLLHSLVPELTKRYITSEFEFAVIGDGGILYRSGNTWPRTINDPAEVTAPFLMMGEKQWKLLIRRHGAPLSEMVAESRRRNLAIGFAVLLLLASSVALLIVLARRAERLRIQQFDFVAGITHELNTPIAAVSSAAQNLADGIVTDPAQVARYGGMIAGEARRLSDTVAQVLDYAGLQARNVAPLRAPVDIAAIVDEAIAQCGWLAEDRGVTIEKQVANDLPLINGDAQSLTRAVQNLIANAIRHGGDGKWVLVNAMRDGATVVLRVEDRGAGLAARDLPHLFEPFYRGRDAERVRGSGLGLAIVKQIAVAHGGKITAERRREGGAAFTLRLPAIENTAMAEVPQHA